MRKVVAVPATTARVTEVRAALVFNFRARWTWVVTFTSWPPCILEDSTGTLSTGGWVGPRAVLPLAGQTAVTFHRFLSRSLITTLSRLVDVRDINEATTNSSHTLADFVVVSFVAL